MQDDLSTLTAQPRPLVVDGRTYMLHPLNAGDIGALEAWAQAQFPDPLAIAEAALERFSIGQQKHLLSAALELSCRPKPKLGTPEIDGLLQSLDGVREVLYRTIVKGDPKFTREAAAALFEALSAAELGRIFTTTHLDKVLGSPKGEAPMPTGAGPTPTDPTPTGGSSSTGQ